MRVLELCRKQVSALDLYSFINFNRPLAYLTTIVKTAGLTKFRQTSQKCTSNGKGIETRDLSPDVGYEKCGEYEEIS